MEECMITAWTNKNIPPQTGRRILVTGANSGIGYEAALELARAGAEVTLISRSEKKAQDARDRIWKMVPRARLELGVMDLSNPRSVRKFAERELASDRPINVLINNAGIMAPRKRLVSGDGYELQFATNVLGPFLLTGLLLPLILRASAPRVVTVSSLAHQLGGPVPLTDRNSDQSYKPVKSYAKTKLADVLIGRELQRRAGDRLLSTMCHPGGSSTNLQFNGESRWLQLTTMLIMPVMQSAAAGAMPTLCAATAHDANPAGFYGPSHLFGVRGPVKETRLVEFAYNEAAAKQLFDQLQEISGIRYPLSCNFNWEHPLT
jgi:NAD(P)-dependent dehydrogenase (short-subunit alcohol dehydrogenase family)